ncbi:Gfo/Idh/MocA family oxidoreductase, partial [bacterium]|nr:Gfo/Idh/MocA family oxidoreductase [bacterium]
MAQDGERIKWGLVGTGKIAAKFARALGHSVSGRLWAAASRSQEKALAFTKEHGGVQAYGDYASLLDDPQVRAVYVATPHPLHGEWTSRALRAGKAVLCEKPLEVTEARVKEIALVARDSGGFLMEAFMYRCHPQINRMIEILRSGEIGTVRLIRATFGYHGRYDPANIKMNPATAGGAILDVGCYTVSMARLVAGVALGRRVAEPLEVTGQALIGAESGIDEYAVGCLRFEGDILAQVATAVRVALDNRLIVFGSRGRLTVESPWNGGGLEGGPTRIVVEPEGGDPRVETIECPQWLYALEADAVAAGLAAGGPLWPAPDLEDSLGNARALDLWRAAAGVRY